MQAQKLISIGKEIEKSVEIQQLDRVKSRLKEIRDGLEIIFTPVYGEFLDSIIPCFVNLLSTTKPSFDEAEVQHQIRNNVLEILLRFPANETLDKYSLPLTERMIDVLENDNEINGVLAVKIITELFKSFRTKLESTAEPFLKFMITVYSNFRSIAEDMLKPKVVTPGAQRRPKKNELRLSSKSCKVLTECPLLVVIVLQSLRQSTDQYLMNILQKMIESFDVPILYSPEAKEEDPEISERYSQLITCQVKTASFFVFSLRTYPKFISEYDKKIAEIVTNLLLKCPSDSHTSRKDILAIIRHLMDSQGKKTTPEQKNIITTIREHFVPHIESLLDDKALLGSYQAYYASVRSAAYSTLADIIHNVRDKLSLVQIYRTITFYTKVMYDPTVPLTIQSMSAKLLAHLIEPIFKATSNSPDRDIGIESLMNILRLFVSKTKSLTSQIIKNYQLISDKKSSPDNSVNQDDIRIENDQDIKDSENINRSLSLEEGLTQRKAMLKALFLGLKNLVYVFLNLLKQTDTHKPSDQLKHNQNEITKLLGSLFKHGLKCVPYFTRQNNSEDDENLKLFLAIFSMLLPDIFDEIFKVQIPYLYQRIEENENYLQVINTFSSIINDQNNLQLFSAIFLKFLVDRMEELGEDTNEATILLKCFKIVSTTSLFKVMKPSLLKEIVLKCLSLSNDSKYSLNYYKLLRFIFRRLASGNCEEYIRELIPTISYLLERLSDLMRTAFKSPVAARDIYTELCLTTPAKLHILCPFLPLLVRPASYALQGTELTTIALKNLELWVKSLRRQRIEILLQPVLPDLINSLFSHLKSMSRSGDIAMRILALLGGTNRKYLSNVPHINDFRNGIFLNIRYKTGEFPEIPYQLSLDSFVKLARRVLHVSNNRQKNMKLTAFKFLQNCVISMLNLNGNNLKTNYKLSDTIYSPPLLKDHINFHVNGYFSFNVSDQIEFFNPNAKLSMIILRRLLSTIIACISDEELKDQAEDFVRNICRHIALVYLSTAHIPDNLSKNSALDLYLDSLIDVFCFEPAAAQFAFLQFVECVNTICGGNQDLFASYNVWDKFRVRICHNCYQPYKKSGACQGIVAIFDRLPKWWLIRYEIDFFKSLLFIIKDSIDQTVVKVVSEAEEALITIFLKCHSEFLELWKEDDNIGVIDENNHDSDAYRFFELVKLLTQELCNYNPSVREVSQKIFGIIVEKSGKSLKDILNNLIPELEKRFSEQFFDKQSRKVRTGIVECLAFLLSQQPQIVAISPGVKHIINFAQEYSSSKPDSGLSSEDRHILKRLRVGCLRLLTKYVNCTEVQESKDKDNETRTQIVSIFFKYIEASEKIFIDIAKSGLKEYISKEKLSRSLLSQSLKPILHNVSKHTNLTEPNLLTLSHLLELCTSYFSPKLGDQLVNNLENWKQPINVSHIQQGEETKIASKIMGLFPLLPEGSKKSLPALCQLTLELENVWSSQISEASSCFRPPLSEFLNLYPQDALAYFMEHIFDLPENNFPYFRLLINVLKRSESSQLRETFKNNIQYVEKIFEGALESQKTNQVDVIDKRSMGITIIYQLSKFYPDILLVPRDNTLVKHLVDCWDNIINLQNIPPQLQSDHRLSRKIIMLSKIFINFIKHNQQETSFLFRLLEVFVYPLVNDYSYLCEFFQEGLIKFPIEVQRKILEETISMFENENQNNSLKVEALNYLFGTIIRYNFVPDEKENCDLLIPDDLIKRIFDTIFNSKYISDDEAISTQILQLAIIFVRYLPNRMKEYRKEMMKMAYNRITKESVGKQYAFELAAYFIEKFDTPDKIIVQVYITLLRAHQPEGKPQVRKALDIISKELAKKSGLSSEGSPKYVSLTKKVLLEEGHTHQQLIHLWSLFVRHPDIFYVARDFFIPKIVNSLGKIGNSNSQIDQKKLSIDLAELILIWENRYLRELALNPQNDSTEPLKESEPTFIETSSDLGKRKREESDAHHPLKTKKLTMPYSEQQEGVAERILSFLIKMSHYIHQSKSDIKEYDNLSEKVLNIFEQSLQLWEYGKIKTEYIYKILQDQNLNIKLVIMVLKLLEVFLKYRKEDFIPEATKVYEGISKYFKINDTVLIQALISFVECIFKVFPLTKTEKPPNELRSLYTDLLRLSAKGFEFEIQQQYGHIALLQLVCHHFPNYSSKFTDAVLKVLIKMLNDHVNYSKQLKNSNDRSGTSRKSHLNNSSKNNTQYVEAILICIDFLSFGGHENTKLKHFFHTVASIIDKNNDINPSIVEKVLTNLRIWLLTENVDPTRRRIELGDNQKAFFISSLSTLEVKESTQIKKQYHNLLLELFNDDSIHKKANALTECIFSNFIAALKSEDSSSKKAFLESLNSRIGPTIFERLSFVFDSKNWLPLKDTFWIKYALDIVIDSLLMDDSVFPEKINSNIFPIISTDDKVDKFENTIFTTSENSTLFQKLPIPEGFDFDEAANKILEEHEDFLLRYREMRVKDLMLPLRELGRESVRLSYDLWIALFEPAWETLTQLQKDDLYESLISLLSSDYHSKQYIKYPNIVQALLEGISHCKPKIQFSPEMLRFLGKSFNAWHISIPMMEEELELMNRNSEFGDRCERFSLCLAELYNVLMEQDMLSGIWRNFSISDYTKHALALEKYGMLDESQNILYRLIEGFSEGEITRSEVTHFELSIWEDQWLATSRRLQQWDTLDSYASTFPPSALKLQCHWMKGDWNTIYETIETNNANKSHLFNICQFSVSIMLGLDRREDIYQQATSSALQRWCALPIFICQTHFDMLHNFQQLWELHESSLLLLKEDQKYHPKELEAFMLNWRDRIPNKWDDIDMWRDILYWRYHFTVLLQKRFDPSNFPSQFSICGTESQHIMNTFASITRKHGSIVPALRTLERLKDNRNKENAEYGERYYELLKCFESADLLDNALFTIDNDVKFKKLTPERKLDILRIRGTVLNKLGFIPEALETYSSSLSLFPKNNCLSTSNDSLGRIVLEWSKLLDSLSEESESLEERSNATIGYFQAIRFGSQEAIPYLSRVLWLMLHKENDTKYLDLVKRSVHDISPHVWLPFIHQLNGMLQRENYGDLAKGIFGRITKEYIQSVFYMFTTNYLMRKLQEDSQNQTETEQSKIVYERIKRHYDELIKFCAKFPVYNQIHSAFNDISHRLSPSLDEELAQCLNQTINDCYSYNIYDESIQVPSHILNVIRSAFKILYHQQMKIPFLIEKRDEMKQDLLEENLSLLVFTERLKKWFNIIQRRINLNPSNIPLESLCPTLHQHDIHHVEIPGQYTNLTYGEKPFIEYHDKILSFTPDVEITRRYLVDCRKISIRSHTGRSFNFLVQFVASGTPRFLVRSEERTYSLLNHFNYFLKTNIQSHSRYLQFQVPVIVPLNKVSRLIQEKPIFSSLEDILYEYCIEKNIDFDTFIKEFWKKYTQTGNRLDAFLYVKEKIPHDILKNHINALCSNWNDYFTIRQRFVKELSLISIANHILNIQVHAPHKILIGRNSGELFQFDFRMNLQEDGTFKQLEAIPFKITQNISHFLGSICMEGELLNSMSVAARALFVKENHMLDLLRLFIRDEISSWMNVGSGIFLTKFLEDDSAAENVALEQSKVLHKRICDLDLIHNSPYSEWKPVNFEIEKLIKTASSDEMLSKLCPTTFPFF